MKREVTFEAYQTPEGKPTCALNFSTSEVCEFLRTKKFGTFDFCACDIDERLLERDHDSLGYTTPFKHCPIWKESV